MPDDPLRYWEALTSPEAGALAGKDAVVVLPLAAVEQHGPHLPLSTDLDIAMRIARRAFARLGQEQPVLPLPPVTVGAS
ncbi:MAG: creatininase family protein, partial [Gemmatimonadota bacterium]